MWLTNIFGGSKPKPAPTPAPASVPSDPTLSATQRLIAYVATIPDDCEHAALVHVSGSNVAVRGFMTDPLLTVQLFSIGAKEVARAVAVDANAKVAAAKG